MASKNKWAPEQIKEFEAYDLKVAQARFAKKCTYPDGESPTILSPEESAKDPEYNEK